VDLANHSDSVSRVRFDFKLSAGESASRSLACSAIADYFSTGDNHGRIGMDGMNVKYWPNKITAANAGWRTQFRFRGSRHRPGVAEFYR
jgi:hypothetical protein